MYHWMDILSPSIDFLEVFYRPVISCAWLLYRKEGMFQGLRQGLRMPCCSILLMCGLIPSMASWLMGYCLMAMGVAEGLRLIIRGWCFLASPMPAVSAQAWGYFSNQLFLCLAEGVTGLLGAYVHPPVTELVPGGAAPLSP